MAKAKVKKVVETLELIRPARKAGGDRYENEEGYMTIYIPQEISRPEGEPIKKFKVTFERVQ